eukprot:TRINITY_DN17800_c0_g1_i1.p1 TRINITY_DN17800_c0_g1~~TRINITY_DN17800_c0_g1_i1.p1  ORF type:complete len:574 (+),score=154.97 TRINITY_DN17800_c0_g1_i1:105-1724(+)
MPSKAKKDKEKGVEQQPELQTKGLRTESTMMMDAMKKAQMGNTSMSMNKSVAAHPPIDKSPAEGFQDAHIPFWVSFTTYLGYGVLIFMGYVRELFRQFFPQRKRAVPEGYAPLTRDFGDFFTRRLYTRIRDCWNRPINTRPGARIGVMERKSDDYNVTFQFTNRTIPCINLASYNYLGFAENPPEVNEMVKKCIRQYGTSAASPSFELGRTGPLAELERCTAEFVGKEAAMVVGMGFATNAATLPALATRGTLIVSDCLNHSSLVSGARGSSAVIRVFQHNRYDQLEAVVRKAIWEGQPRTHRPWAKIIILIEGVYSMEGEIVDLAKVVQIKKRYKCDLYVDEAHSIGALGASGKGVCESCGVNPKDVDILMGTYTKSFGSIGGYVAGDKRVIDRLRRSTGGSVCATAMAAPCCEQAVGALRVIQGKICPGEGPKRLRSIRENAAFFRQGLVKLGLTVYGCDESPVIPALLYNPAKMPAFSRECLKRGLAVVVVGYPATPLIESRVRFCISAEHTREDLQRALDIIAEVSEKIMIKYQH